MCSDEKNASDRTTPGQSSCRNPEALVKLQLLVIVSLPTWTFVGWVHAWLIRTPMRKVSWRTWLIAENIFLMQMMVDQKCVVWLFTGLFYSIRKRQRFEGWRKPSGGVVFELYTDEYLYSQSTTTETDIFCSHPFSPKVFYVSGWDSWRWEKRDYSAWYEKLS